MEIKRTAPHEVAMTAMRLSGLVLPGRPRPSSALATFYFSWPLDTHSRGLSMRERTRFVGSLRHVIDACADWPLAGTHAHGGAASVLADSYGDAQSKQSGLGRNTDLPNIRVDITKRHEGFIGRLCLCLTHLGQSNSTLSGRMVAMPESPLVDRIPSSQTEPLPT